MDITRKGDIYVEDGHVIPPLRLEGGEYARAIQALVVVCSDTVFVNRAEKLIYLVKRKSHPMRGWYSVGGRRLPGETAFDGARRTLRRETGLEIDPARFSFLTTIEHVWKTREEEPQDVGKHDLIFAFTLELTPEERAAAERHLDTKEHEPGLHAFDRAKLVAEGVHPSMRAMYDLIFPPEQ